MRSNSNRIIPCIEGQKGRGRVVIPILILVFGLAKPINSHSKVLAMTSGKLIIISDGEWWVVDVVCLCIRVFVL